MTDNKSTLATFRKVAILTDGKLERLYWEFQDPAYNREIDMAAISAVWRSFGAKLDDPKFLKSRGFYVIADGVELKLG